MGTTIKVHFSLTGKFDPEVVTEKIGINPSKIWRCGEPIQKTKLKYKHDGWRLSTDEMESLDLNDQLSIIETRINPYRQSIVDICKELNLDAEFSCVVEVEEDRYPALHFDREIIKQISELNAEIDIDIY